MVTLRSRTRSQDTPSTTQTETNPIQQSQQRSQRRKRKRSKDDDSDDGNDGNDDDDDDGLEKGNNSSSTGFQNGRPFELISDMPATIEEPNYNSILTHPLSVKDSGVLYNSLLNSRRTWIANYGNIFPLYWKKDTNSSGTDGNSTSGNGSGFSIKDKMQKMCDCRMIGGPHRFDIKLFILKDEVIENKWQEEQDLKKREKEIKKHNDLEMKKQKMEAKIQKRLLKQQEKEKARELKLKTKLQNEMLKQKQREQAKKLKEEARIAKLKNSLKSESPKPKPKPRPKSNSNSNSSAQSSQSPADDTKMIANLNLLAQRDPKLGKLMNKVAVGQANNNEVAEFKKIIEIAKKMPPPPGWKNPNENIKPTKVVKPVEKINTVSSKNSNDTVRDMHSENNVNQTTSSTKIDDSNRTIKDSPKTENKPNDNNIDQNKAETATITENNKAKPDKSKDSLEKENTNKSVTDSNGQSETTTEWGDKIKKEPSTESINVENKQPSEQVVKKKPGRKPKVKNGEDIEEDKLTAFQSKYVNGATLILEYVEDKNVRYYIPKDSIIEYVQETNEFIISWITIHNEREITRFAKRSKKPMDSEVYFLDGCPSPLFSSITVRILDMPKKFHQIVTNSVNTQETVQRLMARILEIGTRLSGYKLWYQLDGYDDSEFAENLRVLLNEYEQSLKGRRQRKSSIHA